jgi:hypothetical protein
MGLGESLEEIWVKGPEGHPERVTADKDHDEVIAVRTEPSGPAKWIVKMRGEEEIARYALDIVVAKFHVSTKREDERKLQDWVERDG